MAPQDPPPQGGLGVVTDQPITINEGIHRSFSRRFVKYLSLCHLFIFPYAFAIDAAYLKTHLSFGIWCGVLYAFSGSFGLVAQAKPTLCSVMAVMVASILSAGISVVFAVFTIVSMALMDIDFWAHLFYVTLLFSSVVGGVTSVLLMSVTFRSVCCWPMLSHTSANLEAGQNCTGGHSKSSGTTTLPPKYDAASG